MQQYPAMLEKKVKLLNYFMNYMKEHLLKAGANLALREGEEFNISFYFSFLDWIRLDSIGFYLTSIDLIWFILFHISSFDFPYFVLIKHIFLFLGDELARIPFLRTWFRTSRAVVMFLTNGTLQVSF